ncbi:hypothetical protein PP488_gp34 [Gordonia phage Agueybana]|uniref:Uncharacterized protein n=1 Tax=Gordonia phage Agueybana TaxID=2859634 RepID=A0AC61N9P0_9CAUD|nr:hypothetical protein PP488_gp34 [Gordonia phage Agueybana]QYC54592.1 hypothetical protein SEA_AGUEYBANA_34 [Gordonia phage Agueybana]
MTRGRLREPSAWRLRPSCMLLDTVLAIIALVAAGCLLIKTAPDLF